MDTSEAPMPDWRTWCRLCAKDDIHSNIDVFQVKEHKSNLTANIEHLFGVCMRQTDELPHMLCTECYSLLTKLATFTERVAKAQDMYHTLMEHVDSNGESVDLHAMRTKYGLLDEEREHLVLKQPTTGVHCYDSKTKLPGGANHAEAKHVVNKMNVKLEECLLDVENEQLQSITVQGDVEEHEVPEDPFHTVDSDCIRDVRSELEDDHKINGMEMAELMPINDRPQSSTRKLHRRRKRNPNYMESETNESDSHSETKRLKRLAKDSTVADAETANAYCCTECPRKFTRLQRYRQHLKRIHLKSPTLPELHCDQCDRVFNTQYKLDRHIVTHQLTCPYCEKKFITHAYVQIHIKSVHMDERPFVCEECGITVHTNASLKSHMLVHTDEKPFICDVCNKAFKDIRKLKKHKKLHDPTKHTCSECGLQLNSRTPWNWPHWRHPAVTRPTPKTYRDWKRLKHSRRRPTI